MPVKRYMIYDYVSGTVLKEVTALRGQTFSVVVCPEALAFDMESNPEIVIWTQSAIRRVDVQTVEIKKLIDLTKLKLPVQHPPTDYPTSLTQKKSLAPSINTQPGLGPTDLIIQDVVVMPKLQLSKEERLQQIQIQK